MSVWYRAGTVAVTNGSKTVTGTNTQWLNLMFGVMPGTTFYGPDGKPYEIDLVVSNTSLLLITNYSGATASGQAYSIDPTRSGSVASLAAQTSEVLKFSQEQFTQMQTWVTGAANVDVTLKAPSGQTVVVPSWKKISDTVSGQAAVAKQEADRAKSEADRINAEVGRGLLMRARGPAILDSERYSLERATGGRQTIIYDAAGNANAMFVLPRFRYEDLNMTADMGAGDVTAFDFGSGSIKSEIFIGAYLASGAGAVSAPRQDPRTSLDHTAARNACSAKGAGWHLMTAHEWAAIALWCMANGYEPIGNTNWGRSHAKTWLIGDRGDRRAPGDASGTGLTFTGSMGAEATHDRTIGGIADLVGNVWEWQDGFLLQDGRFKLSAHNTQDEASWAFAGAYLDASTATGGNVILSHTVSNRLGALGDNANAGNSANTEWKVMAKSSSYVSSQLLKRLLIEPAGVLPQGRIYMRNFGERLPYRGGDWGNGANAGLAALYLSSSRADTRSGVGFRSAFA